MKNRDSYVYIVAMVFCALIFAICVPMEYMMAKLIPMIISGSMFILAGLGFIGSISKSKKLSESQAKKESTARERWIKYVISFSWMVGLVIGIYLIGFTLSVFLFIFFYMKTNHSKLFTSAITSVVATAAIWGVFEFALQLELYRGLIFGA